MTANFIVERIRDMCIRHENTRPFIEGLHSAGLILETGQEKQNTIIGSGRN